MHGIAPNSKEVSYPKCWNSAKVEKAWRDIWWGEGGFLIKSQSWGHSYKPHGMMLFSYQKTVLSAELNFPLNIMWDSRKPSRSVKDFQGWAESMRSQSCLTRLNLQIHNQCPSSFFWRGNGEVVTDVYKCVQYNPQTFCMASSARVTNFRKKGINWGWTLLENKGYSNVFML